MPPTLRILHVLARSGGTLVSKCLASMSEVVLLSEIHPRGVFFSPSRQAASWFGLMTPEEVERLDGPDHFPMAIAFLCERAGAQGRKLILREWSHLDFYGLPFIDEPLWRSSLAETFTSDFTLRRAAVVRHPVEQLISMNLQVLMTDKPDLGRFLKGYRRFAEMAVETGFVRYEDVTMAPDATLRHLSGLLGVTFDPAYAERWSGWRKITGDGASSRGGAEPRIRPLPRWPASPDLLARLGDHPDYRASLALLGYEHPVEG